MALRDVFSLNFNPNGGFIPHNKMPHPSSSCLTWATRVQVHAHNCIAYVLCPLAVACVSDRGKSQSVLMWQAPACCGLVEICSVNASLHGEGAVEQNLGLGTALVSWEI